ncbi:MAG: hypothetical protein ACSLE1_15665 [Sphingobium sp.]
MTSLKKIGECAKKAAPFFTSTNLKIALAVATIFGLVAPDRATQIRNDVLEPLGVAQSAGDLL